MVHAYFERSVACALGTARERERYAPMIVVRSNRSMGLAAPGEREPQRLLGAGLADGAGDRDDLRVRACARRPRQVAQALEHVVDDEERRMLWEATTSVGGNDRKACARRERGLNEVMAVAIVAPNGEERFAGRNRARVDRDARHRRRQWTHRRRARRAEHRPHAAAPPE